MVRDELQAFFESTARPRDWKARLAPWANFAAVRGARLAAMRPEQHDMLLGAIREVQALVERSATPVEDATKEKVALLAGLVHSLASWLHKDSIAPYDTEAFEAARDHGDGESIYGVARHTVGHRRHGARDAQRDSQRVESAPGNCRSRARRVVL